MRPAKKNKQLNSKEIKTLVIFCLVSLLAVAAWLTFSPNGLVAYLSVKGQMENVQAENSRLREENRHLQETLDKIKSDPSYLEETARSDYDLLKKNENVFEFTK